MLDHRVLLLDGSMRGDKDLSPILAVLTDELEHTGAQIQSFSLHEMKFAHCIGNFECWTKTPGLCIYDEPQAHAILQTYVQSDTTILFTPVVFGGYSSQLKQIVDRLASLVLPYFESYHGEMHHKPRYSRYPRLVGVGVQRRRDAKEAELFKLLVGRNAINFHAPSCAADVVASGDDPASLRVTFRSLFSRKEQFPFGESVKSLMPMADEPITRPAQSGARRACLIVGSPKTRSPSTSNVLGTHLLGRLKDRGWDTESLTLGASLQIEKGNADLLAAVDRADLIIFTFPLYVDALPFLMTKALELIADHRLQAENPRPQGLFAIANNGFIESYQNNVALSICRCFARQNGMTWMGALALGAGEAVVGGRPLKSRSATGVPCTHVIHALDVAGDALARWQAVPADAVGEIAGNPIPYTPFAVWRSLFTRTGNRMWEEEASENGVSKQELLARPFAA